MRARHDLRAHLRSLIAMILIAGVFGGVVLASVAGARRTASAVPRALAAQWTPDGDIDTGNNALFPTIERLPEVRDWLQGAFVLAGLLKPDGTRAAPLGSVSTLAIVAGQNTPPRVVAGRAPDQRDPSEIIVNETAARLLHAHVGSTYAMKGFAPSQLLAIFSGKLVQPTVDLPPVHVVGIVRSMADLPLAQVPGDVQWIGNGFAAVDHAWFTLHGSSVGNFSGISVRLKHGLADRAAFERDLAAATHGQAHFRPGSDDLTAALEAERGTNAAAFALYLFAILAGFAFVLMIGQSLSRQLAMEATDHPILRALGVSRRQLVATSAIRLGILALGAAAVAVAVAIALSPLTPIGLARRAEIHPGLSLDATILALGAVGLVLVIFAISAPSISKTTRARALMAGDVSQPDAEARAHGVDALARSGVSPAMSTGLRLALEPGRGRTAVPVRSTIIAATVALAALMAATTFGLSMHHLEARPALQGWTWTAEIGNPHSEDLTRLVLPRVLRAPGVTAVTGDSFPEGSEQTVDNITVIAIGLNPIRASIGATMLDGRMPATEDEIAIGSRLLRRLHKHVGDAVAFGSPGHRPVTMRIVGNGLISPWAANDQIELGGSVLVTRKGLLRVDPAANQNLFLVRAPESTVAQFRRDFPTLVLETLPPAELQNLNTVNGFPVALAGLLTVLAIATIGHTLISSVRRRRRDLALLKTLGFLRGQVRGAVSWQATTISLIAGVIALPLGIIAGRWGWTLYAGRIGIPAEPAVPALLALMLIPGTVVIANVVAAMPARAAARTRPSEILRTE